ncbi:unnamed protein product [Rotaria socialis]|uniref:Uncharacterized protein n=2 Tax=Rotaria socialis TaxID=392032 RepID=A0A817TPA8_9BILA|nr:unnamed protein product [Rotaria socialis]
MTSELTTNQTPVAGSSTGETAVSQAVASATSTFQPSSNTMASVTSVETSVSIQSSLVNTNGVTTVLSSAATNSMASSTVNSVASSTQSSPYSAASNSNTMGSSEGTDSTSNYSITSYAPATSASVVSTASPTPLVTNITATYSYNIVSNSNLTIGLVNNINVTQSVQNMVITSFNLSNFNITVTVTRVEIQQRARASSQVYQMLVDILFTSANNACQSSCIRQSVLLPTVNISLPDSTGQLVPAAPNGLPTEVPSTETPTTTTTTTTATVTPQKGGSSPGIPAQLGMGLGISLIGILLIAEIIFLYRKYGLSNTQRQRQYAMTDYS